MIKLREASITNGVPGILAAQPWVQALGAAWGRMQGKTLDFADASQIYTAVDTMPEAMLDILAGTFKVDWYDASYPVETKRRLIKTALQIRRTIGTVYAVRAAVGAVFPESDLEEWFEYGGRPSYFQIICTIDDAGAAVDYDAIRRAVSYYKRMIARLEGIYLQTLGGLIVACNVEVWRYDVPRTSTGLKAGTYPRTATHGPAPGADIEIEGATDAAPYFAPTAGTRPNTATHSAPAGVVLEAAAKQDAFFVAPPAAGTGTCESANGGGVAGDAVAPGVDAQVFGFDIKRCGELSTL